MRCPWVAAKVFRENEMKPIGRDVLARLTKEAAVASADLAPAFMEGLQFRPKHPIVNATTGFPGI